MTWASGKPRAVQTVTAVAGSGAAGPGGGGDADLADDGFSTAPTATAEDTPLLRSGDGASFSSTLRDGLPGDDGNGGGGAAATTTASLDSGGEIIGFRRGLCIILSMWALIFLQASNMSGMTMTQSEVAADLGAYEGAMWFTSAYLITTASSAPLVGRLATIFPAGALILGSALLFSAGALIASQAHSFAVFILGRVVVGLGGGGIMTLSFITVLQLTSRRRRGLFVGLVNAGFTVGLSTGAVVFGALLPAMGWRALFWAQTPIGIVAGLGVYLSMPHFHGSPRTAGDPAKEKTVFQKLASIDYAGALFLTLTIVLFLYGLSGTIQSLPIMLSAAAMAAFVAVEYFVAGDPIIPLKVLRSRGVLLTCLAQLGFMAARWTILYYAPIFVLAVRGLPAAVAGSVLIPTNAGFGTGGLLVGWLHVRRAGSFWLPCLVSLALFAAALFCASLVSTADAPAGLYVLVIFANGLCTGALLNYTLAHLLHLTAPADHFMATSLLATFRGFAGSFGTAIGGGYFVRALAASLAAGFRAVDGDERRDLVARLIGSPALVFSPGVLSPAERAVAVAGYQDALCMLYRAAAALSLVVLLVQAGTGWTAPGAEDDEEVREAIAEHDGNMEA